MWDCFPRRTMKILHVTQCRGGGVPRAMDMLAEVNPGNDHYALSPEPAAHDARFFADIRRMDDGLAAVRTLRRTVRELRPDIVHAHSSWAGMTARASMLGIPVVYQPHAFVFDGDTRGPSVAGRLPRRGSSSRAPHRGFRGAHAARTTPGGRARRHRSGRHRPQPAVRVQDGRAHIRAVDLGSAGGGDGGAHLGPEGPGVLRAGRPGGHRPSPGRVVRLDRRRGPDACERCSPTQVCGSPAG